MHMNVQSTFPPHPCGNLGKTKKYANLNVGRTSLVVQRLGICAPNAGGPGSVPGQRTRFHIHAATKSLHATTKESACHN